MPEIGVSPVTPHIFNLYGFDKSLFCQLDADDNLNIAVVFTAGNRFP